MVVEIKPVRISHKTSECVFFIKLTQCVNMYTQHYEAFKFCFIFKLFFLF